MKLPRARIVVLAAAIGAIPACTSALLPSFDGGALNPDIHFLRAGEVMQGVKCAMVAFMKEREETLLKQRESDAGGFYKNIETLGTTNTYLVNATNANAKNLNTTAANLRRCDQPGIHWEKGAGCKPNRCDAHEKTPLGVSLWEYPKTDDKSDKGTCKPIPDYSRFALNSTQSAGIDLTLIAANTGQVAWSKIDANRLDPGHSFLAPGGGPNSAPFPSLSASMKGTTTFELAAVMPQTIHGYLLTPSVLSLGGRPPSRPDYEKYLGSLASTASRRTTGTAPLTKGPQAQGVVGELEVLQQSAASALTEIEPFQLDSILEAQKNYITQFTKMDLADYMVFAQNKENIKKLADAIDALKSAASEYALEDETTTKDITNVLKSIPKVQITSISTS